MRVLIVLVCLGVLGVAGAIADGTNSVPPPAEEVVETAPDPEPELETENPATTKLLTAKETAEAYEKTIKGYEAEIKELKTTISKMDAQIKLRDNVFRELQRRIELMRKLNIKAASIADQ